MTMPSIGTPELYRSSERTERANAMIADAGTALQKLASENTELHERRVELAEKLSSAERKSELFRVAIDCANRGVLKLSSVNDTVARWHAEGRDPQYYADLHSSRVDLSFASAEGALPKQASQVVDKTSSSVQDGDYEIDHGRFDAAALDKLLAELS